MEKKLNVKYHTQRNNTLFPSSTCGTTCVAMYLSWLNSILSKNYECDDDKILEALATDKMIDRAKAYIQNGDKWVEQYLQKRKVGNLFTKYNHLNNIAFMLAEVSSYLTNYEFDFKCSYRSVEDIKKTIDEGMPVIISGKFTKSGHYILIIGYDDNNNFICHDPYGNWNKGYFKDDNGKEVCYNIDKVIQLVTNKTKDNKLFSIKTFKK